MRFITNNIITNTPSYYIKILHFFLITGPSTVAPTPTATGSNPWPPPASATDKPAKSKT